MNAPGETPSPTTDWQRINTYNQMDGVGRTTTKGIQKEGTPTATEVAELANRLQLIFISRAVRTTGIDLSAVALNEGYAHIFDEQGDVKPNAFETLVRDRMETEIRRTYKGDPPFEAHARTLIGVQTAMNKAREDLGLPKQEVLTLAELNDRLEARSTSREHELQRYVDSGDLDPEDLADLELGLYALGKMKEMKARYRK